MDNRRALIVLTLGAFLLPDAAYTASQAAAKPAPGMQTVVPGNNAVPGAAGVQTPAKPKPVYQTYTYYGDRYRDPFIPLVGEFRRDQISDRPPQISTLILKGIVQDQKGRMALLTSGVSSYILRGGRLYDGRNHLMKGISGVIKAYSVVLMGSDRTVRELQVTTAM